MRRPLSKPSLRAFLGGAGAVLALALALAACTNIETDPPSDFGLGGGSEIEGFDPTPTPEPPLPGPTREPTAPGPATPLATQPPPPPRTPGQAIFTGEGGCTACHTVDSIPEARGVIGPNLTTVADLAGQRISGLSAEEYLRQSIQEPSAFVVEGFAPVMAVPATVQQSPKIDQLVEFLLTLTTAGPTTPAEQPPLATNGGGDVSLGRTVFTSEGGCIACHTVDSIPEARGAIGPDLTHVASGAAQRVPGLSAEEYIRQSIAEPSAFVVEGFAPVMAVPAALQQSPKIDQLVAFLLSLE